MPNAIQQSSSRIVDEKSVQFSLSSFEDPSFTTRSLVYSRWFQWFEMGIVVLIVGTFGIIIYLIIRMRRVDQVIEEEYSLERAEEMIRAQYETKSEEEGSETEARPKEEKDSV